MGGNQHNALLCKLRKDISEAYALTWIKALLPFTYTVTDEPPQRGKDYNDYLKITLGIRRPQEIERF